MKAPNMLWQLISIYKKAQRKSSVKHLMFIALLLMSSSMLRAQAAIDTTQKLKVDTAQKTEEAPIESKNTKGKKKEKASTMDKIVAEKKKQEVDSAKAETKGNKKGKPETARKQAKPEPPHEPKIIPGAEEKANAAVKDKEDRTMKGPSGQKVYASPKGGKYYIDVNGNKKFLKKDIQQ